MSRPDRPPCPHRRVREHGAPRLVKGPPPGTTHAVGDASRTGALGYHVAHAGTCMDCGWPVLRLSPPAALGPWETVAGGAPAPRYRRQGMRYGTGMDDAA